MNKQIQLEKLEKEFNTLKYEIESEFHIPTEDPQLASVIESIEKMAYYAITAIIPPGTTMESIPKIHFLKSNHCEQCNGSGSILDDSAPIRLQIEKCYRCGGKGRII